MSKVKLYVIIRNGKTCTLAQIGIYAKPPFYLCKSQYACIPFTFPIRFLPSVFSQNSSINSLHKRLYKCYNIQIVQQASPSLLSSYANDPQNYIIMLWLLLSLFTLATSRVCPDLCRRCCKIFRTITACEYFVFIIMMMLI